MPETLPICDAAMHATLSEAFAAQDLASLLEGFEAAIAAEVVALDAAFAQQDRAEAAARAHRLVSATAQYGFPALAAQARQIETELLAGGMPAATARAGLATLLAQTLAAARSMRQHLAAG